MEFHEAAAWFELGRRWVSLDRLCSPPPNPVEARRERYRELVSLTQTLSLPMIDVPSPAQSPKQFAARAGELWTQLLTRAVVVRGTTAVGLMHLGALYFSTVTAQKASTSKKQQAINEFGKSLKGLGVPSKEVAAATKRFRELTYAPKFSNNDEGECARYVGEIAAQAVASASGIKVGEAVLPNSIALPDRRFLVLPKRLVGYREEISTFLQTHPYARNVFLMMPFRDATVTIRSQIRQVCQKYKLHLVIADESRIVDNDLNSNVLACLLASAYGIAVFARPEVVQTINPNVSYELGMMHRDDKVCLILKDKRLKALQTDLVSHLYVDYSPSDKQSIVVQVEKWIQERVL